MFKLLGKKLLECYAHYFSLTGRMNMRLNLAQNIRLKVKTILKILNLINLNNLISQNKLIYNIPIKFKTMFD